MKSNKIIVNKFISILIKKGKKQKTQKLILNCFKAIRLSNKAPESTFRKAICNVSPTVGITIIKKGKKTTIAPKYLTYEQRISYSIKWLIKSALKQKKNQKFKNSLCQEILSASNFIGSAFKKKIEVQSLIETNFKIKL